MNKDDREEKKYNICFSCSVPDCWRRCLIDSPRVGVRKCFGFKPIKIKGDK